MVGGGKFFPPLLVSLRLIRRTGTTLPVEVFVPEQDYEAELCETVLAALGAICRIFPNIPPLKSCWAVSSSKCSQSCSLRLRMYCCSTRIISQSMTLSHSSLHNPNIKIKPPHRTYLGLTVRSVFNSTCFLFFKGGLSEFLWT